MILVKVELAWKTTMDDNAKNTNRTKTTTLVDSPFHSLSLLGTRVEVG